MCAYCNSSINRFNSYNQTKPKILYSNELVHVGAIFPRIKTNVESFVIICDLLCTSSKPPHTIGQFQWNRHGEPIFYGIFPSRESARPVKKSSKMTNKHIKYGFKINHWTLRWIRNEAFSERFSAHNPDIL